MERAHEAMAGSKLDEAVAHLSAAIRALEAEDEKCAAAMASVQMGDLFAHGMGNLTAGRAWWARARRMLEDEPDCVEQGWVAVAALGCHVDDPDELLSAAEFALARARQFGDLELETKALADAGLAHVQAGRISQGMEVLDEAMGLACGLQADSDATGKSVCSFFTACYFAADFARAGNWADLMRRRGLIDQVAGTRVFLSSHCDSVQASLLQELGRWGEAETLLLRAAGSFTELMGQPSWHPDIELALLRVRQGRLVEAEELLLGKEQAVQALLPAARLHFARRDLDLARATADRALKVLGSDRLRVLELLTLLVDVELAAADHPAAVALAARLADMTESVEVGPLRARAVSARARVLTATGKHDAAVQLLEDTVDSMPAELLWLRATLSIQLARSREAAGDRAGAEIDARAASGILNGLDVVVSAEDRELLDHLAPVPSSPPREALLSRSGRGYAASAAGRSVHLRATKGLVYLSELLARPGHEIHVFDLVAVVEGAPESGGPDRRSIGDAGEILDEQARSEYRRRVEQLRSEIDDAFAAGMLDTAERLQAELDLLLAALAEAFGLGGRSRRASSAVEKARLNVTRAIRSAISVIAEALPEAGAALDEAVRTGVYCAYAPGQGVIRWSFIPE